MTIPTTSPTSVNDFVKVPGSMTSFLPCSSSTMQACSYLVTFINPPYHLIVSSGQVGLSRLGLPNSAAILTEINLSLLAESLRWLSNPPKTFIKLQTLFPFDKNQRRRKS